MVSDALLAVTTQYSDAVLFDNSLNRYIMTRMKRIMTRTVNTISYQLRKGRFLPEEYEVSFSVQENLDELNVSLNEPEKMKLKGRIDRVDTYEDDEHVYVKVVDYKSGDNNFSLAAFYYGLQLQLVVYLNEAMKKTEQKYPNKEVVPAAMLYYHMADPIVDAGEEMSEEAINQAIRQKLRMNGLVNGDINVTSALDSSETMQSDCVPLDYKNDGSFKSSSSVTDGASMKLISDYAVWRMKEIGKKIYRGEIPTNPIVNGDKDSCTYCRYQEICGFNEKEGWEKRRLVKEDEDVLLKKMKQEMFGGEED